MRAWNILLSLLLLLLLSSCSLAFLEDGEYFFIERDQAVMPVWVKGNPDSDTFVIYLHGGPNDGCIHFALAGWPLIEDTYRMVWWDQRHAGQSQGNPDISQTAMEDYVEDLGLLIGTINNRYTPDTIILMGTSWGSAVGLAYLAGTSVPANVQGFISLFGTHDFTASYAAARTRLLAIADDRIADGEDPELWQAAHDFYTVHTVIDMIDEFNEHFTYVRAADGYTLQESFSHVENDFSADYIFASPVAALPMLMTNGFADSNEPFMERILTDDSLSAAGALSGVTLPALIISGGRDLTAPEEVSTYIAGELPSSLSVTLPSTAHFSFGTQADLDLFNSSIADFLSDL